jgi:hypothetical protein
LNTIPTADLLPFRQLSLGLQNGNASLRDDPTLLHQPQPLVQSQAGLSSRWEGGIDIVPAKAAGDYRPQLNLKWQMLRDDRHLAAVGIGVAELGVGFSSSYYLVASVTLNYQQVQHQKKFSARHRHHKLRGRRAHVGFIHTQDGMFPMLGMDWEVSDAFVLYSDWISGGPNAVSLGGVYILNADTSIGASLLYGNREQPITGLLVNYTRTARW